MKSLLEKIRSFPLVSYLARYWWVVAILWVAYVAARADSVFAVLDVFAYLPLAFAAWVALPLLWRNIFNRNTTDRYVDEKKYQEDFQKLDYAHKVDLTVRQMGHYLIGSAIIVHALLSNLF